MVRLPVARLRLLLTLAAFAVMVSPARISAQDDPNDAPLGDVARNLRKKTPPAQPVVDDDNLGQVMERADTNRSFGSALKYRMAGEGKGFQVAAPDVTCSLSFTANVKSLLSGQFAQMDLPPGEMAKIKAQATIEGDALTVPVFNGTDWHVSELAVALTVIRRNGTPGFPGSVYIGSTGPEANQSEFVETDPLEQVRAEKKPDVTVIYRMRTAAPPWERAVFSAPLDIDLSAGTEWHWAIVQAKGYPPESYANAQRASAEKKDEIPSFVPAGLLDPENPLAVTPEHR